MRGEIIAEEGWNLNTSLEMTYHYTSPKAWLLRNKQRYTDPGVRVRQVIKRKSNYEQDMLKENDTKMYTN